MRHETADSRQQTADSRQQTADSRQQTADSRQQTADSRQQTADKGPETRDWRQGVWGGLEGPPKPAAGARKLASRRPANFSSFLYDFRILDLPPPLPTRLSHSLYDFFLYCSYTPLYPIPTTCLICTHYFHLYGHNDMLFLL